MCEIKISIYPELVLRKQALYVENVSDSQVQDLVSKLLDVMDNYSHCVGLAANQIGSDLNVFVADASKNDRCDSKYGRVVLINPKLVESSGEQMAREGCMSIPELTGNVSRAKSALVEGFDADGKLIQYDVSDFEARVFLHEIDHLNGKVFLDRVKSSSDVFARKTFR